MKKTKLIMLVTLVTSMVALAACNSGSPNTATSEQTTKTDGAKESEAPKDSLKIAIVSSPSGVDDGSFNQNNYEGILNFIKSNPDSTVKAIQEPKGDPDSSIKAVADIVADYDVIVVPGYQFAGISTIATENPSKKFILIDSNPASVDDVEVFDNIFAMTFAEQESGFFAGVTAALETKTNKVAMIGGAAYPSVVNYHFGFNSGVNYANKVYNTNVEVVELAPYAGVDVTNANIGGNYVGDFNDEATGKVIGNAIIKEGVDIIFVAAGTSGNGVFTAAKEADNVKIIGCDTDQFNDGVNGSSNIIITSALKVMDLNVERALTQIKEGSFQGENALKQADTDSTGIVIADGRHQLSDDTIGKYKEVFAKVKDGTIVPASNFNGSTPEDFVGLPK